ncbi:MAG: hypothetical protein H6710_01955 [Myxococcales bacterium]|nr:hypothetical protein [Myxococcales bacterium]MCB9702837.1 hypothetical protein [Myxococcales bacterium]
MAVQSRLLTLEDLIWAIWLVLLAPIRGGLFLDGGPATLFLLVAALGFWVSAFLGERGREGPRSGWLLLLSLGVCTILIDAALKQIGAEMRWRMINTVAPLVLGVVLAIQHRSTGGRTWLRAPRWLRRVLAWPFVMILADNFAALIGAMVDLRSPLSIFETDGDLGPALFTAFFSLGLIAPMLYAFFVVAPRRLSCVEESAQPRVWIVRYLWALLTAVVGATIVEPLVAPPPVTAP